MNINVSYHGNWTHDEHLKFQNYNDIMLDIYNHENFVELTKNDIKPIFIFYNKNDIKIEFKGAFFKGKDIRSDIDDLRNHYYQLLADTIYNTASKYNVSISINRQTVYRIDVSTNIPSINLNNITFSGKYNKGHQTRSYQFDTREGYSQFITGWECGKRGRKTVQLKIYLKHYDKNKKHDLIRFGTDDFTRIEYEIGAEFCHKFGFKHPKELMNWRPRKWKNILLKVHENKEYIIPDRKIIFSDDFLSSRLKNFTYPPDVKYYGKETVLGIINNKLSDQEIREVYSHIKKVYL